MLLRLMEGFGVKVGTLQHVLEGYKVADEIAQHGAGASTFSDWWAYKFEVYDAIPHNGSLMRERGVRLLYPEPKGGTAGSRVNFIHPKDAGGVLVELVQPGTEDH